MSMKPGHVPGFFCPFDTGAPSGPPCCAQTARGSEIFATKISAVPERRPAPRKAEDISGRYGACGSFGLRSARRIRERGLTRSRAWVVRG